jgi:alpha-glucosidase (family GH31 glycosyl hydrolase)
MTHARTPQPSLPESSRIAVGKARFTVIAAECIRLEYSESGQFVDAPSLFAVNRAAGTTAFTLHSSEGETVLDTGAIRLSYRPDGSPFGPHNLAAAIRGGRAPISWSPGRSNRANLGGTLESLDRVAGPVELGEGLLARDGWYLLDDSQGPLWIDDWVQPRPAHSGLDWYLFGYGLNYKAALRALTAIGGAVPLPRRYALGSWYSRYWPYSSGDYRQIVEEYAQRDFPLDVLVLDMDWHRVGWTGWSWNRELLPDAEALLGWLHERRIFVALNDHPAAGVGPHEDCYRAFMQELGRDSAAGEIVPFDAASRSYLEALWKHAYLPLERDGVDFWWLDWQQDRYTRSIPSLENLRWLNHCYYRRSGASERRGLLLSRWGGWGDHRHPIHFSGDAFTSFDVLAFQVPFTATAGNVGCFFWSHDIGGHKGERNEEAVVRWVQFGAVSAALRLHSARVEALERRPWTYSPAAQAAMRSAFRLRSELFPYIYSSVAQSSRESLPLLRPMYLEYPDADEAYANPQQYLFGDAFLVAPIAAPGAGPEQIAAQDVWFPDAPWYHWFTGEQYGGGKATIQAPLDEFPLFARGGVPIPMQPYTPRMTTEPLAQLIVRCFPGALGKHLLYEDDGISREYCEGAFALTELSYVRCGRRVAIEIGATRGSYRDQLPERSICIELPCTGKPVAASADGEPLAAEYDVRACTTRVRVPLRSIRVPLRVTLEIEERQPR